MKEATPKQILLRNLTAVDMQNGKITYNMDKRAKLENYEEETLKNMWTIEKRKAHIIRIGQEVKELLYDKKRSTATELIVSFFKEFYTFKTTRSDVASEIWIYKEGIYLPEGKSYIQEITREITGKLYTSHIAKNVIDKIETDTLIEQEKFFEEQNEFPYLIPVQNGLLNLETTKIEDYTSEIAFFNKLSMKYNPKAKCPIIQQFIKEITNNEEDIKIIQEIFGYCLIKDYKYEKGFMFYGSHGRNGKSKLLELLKRMIGIENTASVSLEDLEKDQFCLSELHNKMVNISADISKEAVNNTGNFKGLTGRDQMFAARKFKTRLKFVNYAKMIFAANNLPPINDSDSDAFWLRWVLIEFPHQFLPEKELSENKDAKLQDPIIMDKLTTIEELEGLLVWSIEGLKRLEFNKDFSYTTTAKNVKLEWMKKSNSVAAFIYDFVEMDYQGEILKQDFKKEYLKYCNKNRLKVGSDKVIKITLEKELQCTTITEQLNIDGQYKKLYYWSNVKWKSSQKTF